MINNKDVFQEAHKLQKCFSPGVIKIEGDKAVVENARIDACTREAHRHDEFKVWLIFLIKFNNFYIFKNKLLLTQILVQHRIWSRAQSCAVRGWNGRRNEPVRYIFGVVKNIT